MGYVFEKLALCHSRITHQAHVDVTAELHSVAKLVVHTTNHQKEESLHIFRMFGEHKLSYRVQLIVTIES